MSTVGSMEPSEGLTFEQAFTRLEDVVRQLEGGQPSLDRAIELYEEGMKLSRHCDAMLRHAQLKVSKLQAEMSSAGQPARGGEDADEDPFAESGFSAGQGSGAQQTSRRGQSGGSAGGFTAGGRSDAADADDDGSMNLPW